MYGDPDCSPATTILFSGLILMSFGNELIVLKSKFSSPVPFISFIPDSVPTKNSDPKGTNLFTHNGLKLGLKSEVIVPSTFNLIIDFVSILLKDVNFPETNRVFSPSINVIL